MAAPTITSITPSIGHPGGKYLVTIAGTNFKLPADPSSTGYVGGTFEESVRVSFNGVLATNVRVYSSSLITCYVPAFDGEPEDLRTGLDVDVILTNLSTPPASVTKTDGFKYQRTSLARSTDGILTRMIEALLKSMKRQIIENVAIYTGIDYDDNTTDGASIIAVADIPAVVVEGPRISRSRDHRSAEQIISVNTGETEFQKFRDPEWSDLSFDVTLLAKEDPREFYNLIQEFILFGKRNTSLSLLKNPSNPGLGSAEFDLFITGQPATTGKPNASGIFMATASLEIRGVPIDSDAGRPAEWGSVLAVPPDFVLGVEPKE